MCSLGTSALNHLTLRENPEDFLSKYYVHEYNCKLSDFVSLHNLNTEQIFFLSFPATGLDRPLGFQEVEAPEFLDNRHMQVARLSALRTGLLYLQGKIPGTHFC
jgi:hypothetical protein